IIGRPRFAEGRLSTDFIAQEFPDGFAPLAEFSAADRIILLAAALAEQRLAGTAPVAEHTVLLDGQPHDITIRLENGGYAIEHEGKTAIVASDWRPADRLLQLEVADDIATVQIERLPGSAFRLTHGGVTRHAQVLRRRAAQLLQMMPPKEA